jgi:hypothetical protein
MSSFFYGVSSTRREDIAARAGQEASVAKATAPSKAADVISAIVPAEALVLYSTIVVPQVTTTGTKGMRVAISDPGLFKGSIIALAILSAVLYLAGRLKNGSLNVWDVPRLLIPAIAFLCWSGLQTPSGLHLIITGLTPNTLVVFGAVGGVALAAVAAAIGYKADPSGN